MMIKSQIMLRPFIIFALLVLPFKLSGQEPVSNVVRLDSRDTTVMAIMEHYGPILPHHSLETPASQVMMWRPYDKLLLGISNPHRQLWMDVNQATIVRPPMPRFINFNSVSLRLGGNGGAKITISNGSAYNYMPWPGSPAGYRDARTLSFPLPR